MQGHRSALPGFPFALVALFAGVGCGGTSPDSQTIADISVCPGGATLEGLDVSKYEGTIDWAAVQSSGKAFAIARVSDGLNYPDAYFDANWTGIKSVGMVRGAYQYFEPAQDPTAQANLLLQHIGTLGPGDLPPVIDVETMGGQTASAVVAAVDQWIGVVQSATGRTPIVYADPSFWSGLGDPSVAADLWIANWGVSCPSVPGAWSGWKFWQYSATGSVPGTGSGGDDLDRFNGSLDDLLAYAGGGSPPSTPTTSITQPTGGATVSGTITVTATASAGANKIELYVDGTIFATGTTSPFSATWDTTQVSDGSHQLSSKAYDAAGDVGSSAAVTVTVGNTAPALSTSIATPVGGSTVSGSVTVTATASSGANKIELYVDSALLATGTNSPFSASWDTTQVSDGNHQLTSKAYDAAGNVATSVAVAVTVSNGGGSVQCPPGTTNVGGTCVPTGGGTGCNTSTGEDAGVASLLLVGLALSLPRRRQSTRSAKKVEPTRP